MKKIITLFALLVSLAAQAYEPLIREDRIWVYETYYSDIHQGVYFRFHTYFKFEGTEEINGRTYHKLNCWNPEEDNPEIKTIAYMREKYQRVYLLLTQNSLEIIPNPDAFPSSVFTNISNSSEVCLYDFDIPDYLPMTNVAAMTDDTNSFDSPLVNLVPSFVRRLSMELNGRNWNLTQFTYDKNSIDPWTKPEWVDSRENILIIEGVGNIFEGFLHCPSYIGVCSNGISSGSRFVKQTDMDGNVIFDVAWVWPWMGVENTRSDDSAASGQAYDLSGKPTADPTPGTVYIRNGRKEIAR